MEFVTEHEPIFFDHCAQSCSDDYIAAAAEDDGDDDDDDDDDDARNPNLPTCGSSCPA